MTCRILHDFWWGKGCHSITGRFTGKNGIQMHITIFWTGRNLFVHPEVMYINCFLSVQSFSNWCFPWVFIYKNPVVLLMLPESPQKFRHRLQGRLGLSYQVPNCCSSGGSGGYLLPDPRLYWMPVAPWVDGFIVRVIPLWKRYPGLMFGQVDSKIEHEMKNVAFQFPKYCFNVCWIYCWG